MTGEEMERAIEFLLQGQAKLEGQIAETGRQLQSYAETQTAFIQIVTRQIEAQGEINASLRASLTRHDERLNQTDERLDRLAGLIEQHVTEGHH